VFKTESGDVLQLSAKQQLLNHPKQEQKQEQHHLIDSEDDVHVVSSDIGQSTGEYSLGGSSAGTVPTLARSASYSAHSSRIAGVPAAPHLLRSATFHIANGGGKEVEADASNLQDEPQELEDNDDDASGALADSAITGSVKSEVQTRWGGSEQTLQADCWVDFLINHVPACSKLQPLALAKVLRSARAFVLDVGGTLVKENETRSGDAIWVVLDGMLQVSRTAVKFASAQQQLVQRVARKKSCIDPAPLPPDTARVLHTGITVRELAIHSIRESSTLPPPLFFFSTTSPPSWRGQQQ
jgi:hypothetical protein